MDHSHCPYGCEHPQPFNYQGSEVCGRCFFVEKVLTVMVPCTKDTCPDEFDTHKPLEEKP